jgi:hypothetical protein
VKSALYWVFVALLSLGAILFARKEISNQALKSSKFPAKSIVDNQRASGFTLKAEASFRNQTLTSRLAASGPMKDDEVIQFVGQSSLILPDGSSTPMGPVVETFKENLVVVNKMPSIINNSIVSIKGSAVVFRRIEVKYPREILPDMVRVYVNDGQILFRKKLGTSPQKMTVECIKLGRLDGHGMELMGADNKSVSSRIIIREGIQEIERESFPFQSVTKEMENVVIRILVPKRSETFNLTTTINEGPTIQTVSPK